MTYKKLTLFVFALGSIAGLNAQPSQSAEAVSPREFRRGINGVRTEIQAADQNAAVRIEKLRQEQAAAIANVATQAQAAITAANAAHERQENELAEAAKREAERLHGNLVLLFKLAAFAVIALLGLGICYIARSNRGMVGMVLEAVQTSPPTDEQVGMLVDAIEVRSEDQMPVPPPLNPAIEYVRELAQRNRSNFVPVRFKHNLFDKIFECVVELRGEKENDVVFFVECSVAVRWDERFNVIKNMNRRGAPSPTFIVQFPATDLQGQPQPN